MDHKSKEKKKQDKQSNKISKKIREARKNRSAKEAAEFNEIHKLLKNTDDSGLTNAESNIVINNHTSSCSSLIPEVSPESKAFHDELIFSIYDETTLDINDFVTGEEKCNFFGKNDLVPTEESFRKLITYHVTENLMPEEESCFSFNLYVLHLMSVHKDASFVAACFDFLTFQKCHLDVKNFLVVFVNFGLKPEGLIEFCDETLVKRFREKIFAGRNTEKNEFPFFNLEMVGRILLQYITHKLLIIDSSLKTLIQVLVKITLDSRISSGSLLPLYSTILTILCLQIQKDFTLEEVIGWVHLKEEHLLTQLEICRNISRSIYPELHESVVLKILTEILNEKILPTRLPIKIDHLKCVLRKLQKRELPPVELYSLLKLVNCSLPGLTATIKDSVEINTLLNSLEQKINKIKDSVDLIKLKLEIAKVGNLVSNNVNDRFTANETLNKLSAKKVKRSS